MRATTSGVMLAPTLVPALKIPVASARSFFGNHSATALMLAGNNPDWPYPIAAETTMNPATVPWAAGKKLHSP
jgi:hypothetical protein